VPLKLKVKQVFDVQAFHVPFKLGKGQAYKQKCYSLVLACDFCNEISLAHNYNFKFQKEELLEDPSACDESLGRLRKIQRFDVPVIVLKHTNSVLLQLFIHRGIQQDLNNGPLNNKISLFEKSNCFSSKTMAIFVHYSQCQNTELVWYSDHGKLS
jgi:hypothetical protein